MQNEVVDQAAEHDYFLIVHNYRQTISSINQSREIHSFTPAQVEPISLKSKLSALQEKITRAKKVMQSVESKLKKESKLFTLIRYFSLIWLIVGSILFWRDIEPLQYCSQSFSDYMYAKLIMGFISFFMNERES